MKTKSNQDVLVVGDKILIKPEKETNKTDSGLYLPEGVKQKESVQGGYIVAVGPGYPLPSVVDEDEPWSATGDDNDMRYISLQAQVGDYAVFLRKSAIDVEFDNEEYVVVSHAAILLLVRDDELVR